jgi:uncharacterized damage-inducible protein DinB
MSLDMIRGLYRYHWWANRRLFDVTAALGDETAARDLGPQWSQPTLRGMLAHIYAADWVWLERWQGRSPTGLPADRDFGTLADLRARWDGFEAEQRGFIEALPADGLARLVAYRDTRGHPYTLPLWPLLQHVVNHATHHRSEIATMLTVVSGSPPATDMSVYHLIASGQLKG